MLTLGTTYSADVRVPGEQLQLLGATAEGAYLLRNRQRLVFHEFATGTERPLDAATATMVAAGTSAYRFSESVQNRYLVFRTVGGPQRIHIVDITTGTYVVPPVTLLPGQDFAVESVRLSPDGRTVAVAISRSGADRPGYQLVSFDVATGQAKPAQEIVALDGRSKASAVLGLAFSDNTTVRVAWYVFPPEGNRVFALAELLKVSTLTV